MAKPKVGIFGMTGCGGEQIVILNCEDQLMDILKVLDIRAFHTAMSKNDEKCDLDIAFVEGAVVQPREEVLLKEIRKRSRLLIALGTCAVWGGVAAMKNEVSRQRLKDEVYGDAGQIFKSILAQPLRSFVEVDFSVSGCPIEKEQFLQAVGSLVHGDIPVLPKYAVCTECKLRENTCLLLEKGQLCLGPITVGGCNARCLSYGIPCSGCRGPVEEANIASEVEILKEKGFTLGDIHNQLRTFAGLAKVLQTYFAKR